MYTLTMKHNAKLNWDKHDKAQGGLGGLGRVYGYNHGGHGVMGPVVTGPIE